MYEKPNLSADSVKVDTDEGRLTLEIAGDFGTVTVDIHGIDLDAFYASVNREIGPWLHERSEALRTLPEARDEYDTGYDLSDPKHPEFHSIHADLYDNREGK